MYTAVMKIRDSVSTRGFSANAKLILAVGGVTTGILLLLAAMLMWAFSVFEEQNRDRLELILIAAAFVFSGLGAHGLDLLQSARRAERRRRLNL